MTNKQALDALTRMQCALERNTDGGNYDDFNTVSASLTRPPEPVNAQLMEALRHGLDMSTRPKDINIFKRAIAAAEAHPAQTVVEGLDEAVIKDGEVLEGVSKQAGWLSIPADRLMKLNEAARLQLARQKSAAEKAGV